MAVLVLFTSSLMQVKKTEAAVQAAVPLAAASGAGYAAVGAYVIGGLLIAAGAAYVLDDPDASANIRQHSMSVWNSFDSATKQAWATAIDASIAAGKGTLALSDSMVTSLQGKLDGLINATDTVVRTGETIKGTTVTFSSSSAGFSIATNYRSANILVNGAITVQLGVERLWTSDPDYQTHYGVVYTANGSTDITRVKFPYPPGYGPGTWGYVTQVTSMATFQKAWNEMMPAMAFPALVKITSLAPSKDYFADSVDTVLQGINTGAKEVALNIDQFLAKSKDGQLLKTNEAGQVVLPNGNLYDGSITWDIPTLKVPSIPTVDAPAVPLDGITVGDSDIPFVGSPTTTAPTTGDTSGILQGLWDWLKGILQAILDAIKALSGLLGLTAIMEAIKALVGTIADSITGAITWTLEGIKTLTGEVVEWLKKIYDKLTNSELSPWKPWTFLWPFLDFLIAAAQFLVNLAVFIVTLPLIPEKQFPDPYGAVVENFKNTTYAGIKPYSLMISTVTFLIGIFIYKLLRRVFNS